jgi:general secretion pathway protein I
MISNKPPRGFTLVEVMVALAVVAVALPALLFVYMQQVDNTGYLRDKWLASQVIENKWTEVQLLTETRGFKLDGTQRGEYTLADRQWYWLLSKEKTAVDYFYRYELKVFATEDDELPLLTQVFFLREEGS